MRSLFKRFFGRPRIIPGEVWCLKGDDSPWPKEWEHKVTILDVRDGWVRYSISSRFNDERLKTATFMHCYRRADESEEDGPK